MANLENGAGTTVEAHRGSQDSPLENAKRLVEPMCRQAKEAHWLGVRMENFLRAYGKRIEAVGVGDVCDYLEGLMWKGQVEWQIKQPLDAIGLLMKFGYQREELSIPAEWPRHRFGCLGDPGTGGAKDERLLRNLLLLHNPDA